MRTISAALVCCLSVTLTNCSIAPIPDDVTRKSTYGIVQQIRCEARRAVIDHGQGFATAAIAYEFNFHIFETNNAGADATGTIPFLAGGSFSIVGSAALNRTRDNLRNFKLVDTFDDLRKMNCSQEALEKNWIYPIGGDIGMYEVVSTFMKLQKTENLSGSDVFTFADTLAFTTDVSGGLKPSLTLVSVPDGFRLTGANGNFTAERMDAHTVTLSLAAGRQPPRFAAAPLGATVFSPAASIQTNSALLSTTLIQAAANAKDRALVELDRQRILALQARSQNLLVGP